MINYIKCIMPSKSSKWELGFIHYIAKFTISRFVISRFVISRFEYIWLSFRPKKSKMCFGRDLYVMLDDKGVKSDIKDMTLFSLKLLPFGYCTHLSSYLFPMKQFIKFDLILTPIFRSISKIDLI